MVTLEEVAAAANVSVSTASRALTGKGQVNQQTIARIQRIAKQLGYSPNSLARALKTNTSRLVGLVVHNIFNSSFQTLAQVVQKRLFEANYQVILCISNDSAEQEASYLETLWTHRIDGLIIVPTGQNLPIFERIVRSDIPVVTVMRRHAGGQFNTVLQADIEGAYNGTRYLLENGHRRIGVILGPADTTSGAERFTGYANALRDLQIVPDLQLVHRGPYAAHVGRTATEALLDLKDPVTAIFCANHEAAQGALAVLSERNIAIPDEISLLCYEDSPWFNSQRPAISVLDNDPRSIGELSADLLLRGMEEGPLGLEGTPRELRIGARLIIRQSCKAIG